MILIIDPVLLNDWHPVASLAELKGKPLKPVRLLGEDVVIWGQQDPSAEHGWRVQVWQDLCMHRGSRLSLGRVVPSTKRPGEACVQCPYHGWQYDPDGRCEHIPAHPEQMPPAKAVVKAYRAMIRFGWVWACLGEPRYALPDFPEWDKPAFRKMLCGPYRVNASGPRLIENFLDVAHFPFVHEGTLGALSHPEIGDYEAEITPQGVVAKGIRVWQPNGYGDGVGGTVEYTYKALRPLMAYLLKEGNGPQFSILLVITPHDLVDSTAWMWMTMNYGHELSEADLIKWQDDIFYQDQPVVTSQRPELLPLDLQAELHLRCDRTSIAYRKWLGQLGLTIGTA